MRAWLAVMLVGCGGAAADIADGQNGSAGATGATGATGPAGPEGPPGPPGTAPVMWVDAEGAEVAEGWTLTVFDADGVAWGVDVETGSYAAVPAGVYYEGPGCTGAAWLLSIHPNRGMSTDGAPGLPDYVVRAKGVPTERVDTASYWTAGQCIDLTTSVSAVPESALLEVSLPASPWLGPLHPEPR